MQKEIIELHESYGKHTIKKYEDVGIIRYCESCFYIIDESVSVYTFKKFVENVIPKDKVKEYLNLLFQFKGLEFFRHRDLAYLIDYLTSIGITTMPFPKLQMIAKIRMKVKTPSNADHIYEVLTKNPKSETSAWILNNLELLKKI